MLLRFLGKVIAFILLIIFIVLLPLTFLTYTLQSVMFKPATYQKIAENHSLYTDTLPVIIAETFKSPGSTPEEQAARDLLQYLDQDEWQEIIGLIAGPEWFESSIENNIDALFGWVDDPDLLAPEFVFDLSPLKSRLSGDEGKEAAGIVLDSLPSCSSSEEAAISSGSSIPACRPSDAESEAKVQQQIESIFTNLGATMLETASFEEEGGVEITPEMDKSLKNLKFIIRVTRRASYLIFLLPLILLLLIWILAVRSFSGLFKWYGWAFFLGGVISLLLILSGASLPILAWQTVSGTAVIDPSSLPILIGLSTLFTQITGPMFIYGGGSVGAGIVLLGLGSLFSRNEKAAEDEIEIEEIDDDDDE